MDIVHSNRKKVLCPVEGQNGKTRWREVGVAFINKDQSINLYIDLLPVNGKLHVRDYDESPPPWQRRDNQAAAQLPPMQQLPMLPEPQTEQEPF
jgi:hypothetical protein